MNKATLAELLGKAILKSRILICVLFAFVIAGGAYFSQQFKVDASADTLLTKNNELYITSQIVSQKFSPSEFILVAYQPQQTNLFTDTSIKDLQFLKAQFSQIERVSHVNSMLNVPLIESRSQLLESEVATLTFEEQDYSLAQLTNLISDHPIFEDLLINSSKDAASLQIVFEQNEELNELSSKIVALQKKQLQQNLTKAELESLAKLQDKRKQTQEVLNKKREQELQEIESIIKEVKQDANVYIGGSYVVGMRLIEIVKSDLTLFGTGVLILISLLLLLLFRTIKWVLFPLLACASSVVITVGILGMLNIPATVISANFIALQLILTLAIMLHLIVCYRDVSRDDAKATQQARLIETLRQKLAPCFFAAVTTSVGFASLMFSSIQPVIDFGKMMLISNAVTLFIALLVFPSVLSFFSASAESREFAWVDKALERVKNFVKNSPTKIYLLAFAVTVFFAIGLLKLNVENSFIDYFHEDTTIYEELSFIDKEFGGSTPLDIVINLDPNDNVPDLFVSAEQVNTVHLAQAAIDAFEATGNVTSLINFTTLAKQLNDDKPLTEYELDAIYSVVDKDTIDELIGAYVDTETNTFRISTRIVDTLPNLNRKELLENIKKDMSAVGISESQYQLTNLFVLYQDILSKLVSSQTTTIAIVYAALALILVAIFRSVRLACIALVPNVITTVAILGLIGWAGIPLDLMTMTIASIAMGIAIDDTIHFMTAYQKSGKEKALNRAFSHTGNALLFTTFLIATGFSIFVFSDFMPSVYFGILTACAMVIAFVTDITLLPALLEKFAKNKNHDNSQSAEFASHSN